MGLFILHAEGKEAECSVEVGRDREGGERLWGEAEGRDSSMTLRETRSAVHHGGGVEPLFSQVGARRLVFLDPGL